MVSRRFNHPLVSEFIAAVLQEEKLGSGACVLFIGSERKRTKLVAEALATDLGRELLRVDPIKVVGKYIGETEKNIDQIFKAANPRRNLLFFDEADAFFGTRTEVRDAHDRFSNLEVGYFLQRLEDYRGIAIFATNDFDHTNEAFLKRCQLVLRFPRKNWAI